MADQVEAAPAVARTRAIDSPRTVLTVVAFVLGVIVGRSIAYQVTRGGFDGGIGAGLWLYGTIALVLLAFAVTVITARIGRQPVGAALRPVAIGAAVLALGGLVGGVTAPFTGGIYRSAAQFEAPGTITLRLDGLGSAFVPGVSGPATCRSLPDNAAVGEVTGLELGTLDGRHLRGTISMPFANEVNAQAVIWIDGADLPEGAAAPTWTGPVTVRSDTGEGSPSAATFDALALDHDPKLPAYVEAFPENLAGSFDWSCGFFDVP